MLREGLAHGAAAQGRSGQRRLARRCLRRDLVFRGGFLQLRKLELHLVDQPRRALGASAMELALQLLDHQLEMRDRHLG